MLSDTQKYTVITGASSGIGYETAKKFASRGKNLIIIARRQERLENLKKEISEKFPAVDVIIKNVDLTITQNIYQLYDDLKTYELKTWINNAGLGNYGHVANQNPKKIETMIHLNIEALTILSNLFVRNYQNIEGTQLINISSAGGYTIVPEAVIYCATKFYVSSFTEGLARELRNSGAKMQVKVLAPAATKTEFGKIANNSSDYDYDKHFGTYHTSKQMADFLLQLYDSEKIIGIVDRETFDFKLLDPLFNYAK
ncbi:SDR family NAD(P)-dependent oxidoreductase [Ligilactobacillus apodemi]|uniref:Short-chain dehydrogenase n=1 Tax=Ligilactobacillus apodemi DSM 16634 = JCM 16172 TaxID=1423724 RepID=A0A0R1TYB9_9LACO|nr:SDR family oxidoreductase [Ligilactobacillus apodemi]KRL83800.1 short-chain dehydrogenase [Ligilactobacillus apodemi DSM 16634 = JCM 16172]